jgi:hypothetical protein
MPGAGQWHLYHPEYTVYVSTVRAKYTVYQSQPYTGRPSRVINARVGQMAFVPSRIHCIRFNCSGEIYSVSVSTVRPKDSTIHRSSVSGQCHSDSRVGPKFILLSLFSPVRKQYRDTKLHLVHLCPYTLEIKKINPTIRLENWQMKLV